MIAKANHMTMCHFKNRKDDGYEKFQYMLAPYVEGIENNKQRSTQNVTFQEDSALVPFMTPNAAAAVPRGNIGNTSPTLQGTASPSNEHRVDNSEHGPWLGDDDLYNISDESDDDFQPQHPVSEHGGVVESE
jgi:hypothetical protein